MKAKLLLLMLLAVAGYISFEFTQNRDPLARLLDTLEAVTSVTQAKPAACRCRRAGNTSAGRHPGNIGETGYSGALRGTPRWRGRRNETLRADRRLPV